MMADQAQAGRGGGAGQTAAYKDGAHALFKRFQALRDGGGGDAKGGRRQIKAATAMDG